ncbi:MAG: peptidoglycan-binding domain-containing protein [Acidimicrobiales bacterium]
MSNEGQPVVGPGTTGDGVQRLQRALRRTPDLAVVADGVYGPATEAAVKGFQQGAGLDADGVVGPDTWDALPDGGQMPTLRKGSKGLVVARLQNVLTNGAPGQWTTTPGPIDEHFGRQTKACVEAFQAWAGVPVDGVVGDRTWSVSLQALSATLETTVGLDHIAP